MGAPKITLYTNHGCPYAHRAHITLKELGLDYEEVIIDLGTPREPWYLEVNPRGLVPSIKYTNDTLKEEIVTESAIVAQFLADAHPSHLLPAAESSPTAPLFRARVAFFVDTFNSKLTPYLFKIAAQETGEEKEALVKEALAAVEKEIEPLLKDASPFFGGSKELTLAEVNTAPFLLRFYAFSEAGLIPASVKAGLEGLPNFSKWANALHSRESVTYIWDAENVINRTKARLDTIKARVKANA